MLKSRSLMVFIVIVILGQFFVICDVISGYSSFVYMYGCNYCGSADKSLSSLDVRNINVKNSV